ncbi:MAG TPA: hypothetical protein VL995_09100 [Cellvibrio sp.]|nr:hypothetical protein [Cellvibrio sp.]
MTQFMTDNYFTPRMTGAKTGLILMAMAVFLSGCGGGSGGGSSNTGQDPDPVTVDLPVAYVQRPVPVNEDGEPVFPDVFRPDEFNPGGELFLKDRATAQAAVTNITRSAFVDNEFFDPESPNYDVKDVSVHPAGDRILFSMRAPLDPDMDEDEEGQPTWNIWEYNIKTKALHRVIGADFEAEKGHDVSPHYLTDGRILFASDRQKRSKEILLDEGKPQFGATTSQDDDITSFLLHTVKEDGTDIQQLTYNQSHDIQPSLLPDGRVLFMRWQGNDPDRLSFYSANPDGTDIQRYFGYTSLNSEPPETMEEAPRLFHPQVLPDGRIAAIYMQNTLQLGGDMVVVDGRQAAEGTVESISIKPVDISSEVVSLHGRFASLSPLHDGTNRLLVSWSQCRLMETATERLQPCLASLLSENEPIEGYEEAPPFYGIWIYDITSQTQLPVVLAENGKLFTEAVALAVRTRPGYIAPNTDPTLALENVGLLHIRSVYDMDGAFNAMGSGATDLAAMAARPAEQRPARFIRLVKAVSIASDEVLDDQDDNIYGNLFNANRGIQEILGYAPVEPDGSVMVKVPSDVAFSIEILDKDGRQIGANHNTLLQVRPGETLQCNGCHNAENAEVVHGRYGLPQSPVALNRGAATAASFPNTQRYDRFGTPEFARMGETMAEFGTRTYFKMANETGARRSDECSGDGVCFKKPNVDLDFTDEWMGSQAVSERNNLNFLWSYNALDENLNAESVPAPTPTACRDVVSWNANCRVVINYEYHIQPFWERERDPMTVTDPDLGVQITANTCIACHSSVDLNGNMQIPKAQLELTRAKIDDQMLSYLQLLNGNQRLALWYNGIAALQIPACEYVDLNPDNYIPQCVVVLDEENAPTCEGVTNCPFVILNELTGELELDLVTGNPVPRQVETPFLPPPMNSGGANASRGFFNKFENNGSHMGFLNPAELKLLSEWLDTEGRYYTNPFEMAIQN